MKLTEFVRRYGDINRDGKAHPHDTAYRYAMLIGEAIGLTDVAGIESEPQSVGRLERELAGARRRVEASEKRFTGVDDRRAAAVKAAEERCAAQLADVIRRTEAYTLERIDVASKAARDRVVTLETELAAESAEVARLRDAMNADVPTKNLRGVAEILEIATYEHVTDGARRVVLERNGAMARIAALRKELAAALTDPGMDKQLACAIKTERESCIQDVMTVVAESEHALTDSMRDVYYGSVERIRARAAGHG